MNDLEKLAVIIGAVMAVLSLPCLLVPQKARLLIGAFPRNKAFAWVFTAICTVWVTRLLFVTPLAFFEPYKQSLYLLAPLFFVLVVRLMEELLAARALGGLLLLVPCLVVDIARQRAIMLVSFAYLLVIIGVILVLNPYLFRKAMAYWIENDDRCRALGMIGTGLGVFVILFGLLSY